MIHIIIIDEHELIREGLSRIISDEQDMVISGSYEHAEDFFQIYNLLNVDVIILDICMSGCEGMEVLKEIKKKDQDSAVLILSMYPEEQSAVQALKNGAAGYITMCTKSKTILKAIRKTYHDGIYLSQSVSEIIANSIRNEGIILPHEKLSSREFQIFRYIGKGDSTTEIALHFCISENTVRTYRRRIMQKMNLDSTAHLIHYAVEHNLS